MRMYRIGQLIQNTFTKEYRNKTLIFLLLFTFLLMWIINAAMSFVLDPLQKSQFVLPGITDKKLYVFYMIISVWGGFLATFLGVSSVRSDFDHRVAWQILSLPMKRIDYLVGRISGTWLIVVSYYVLSILAAMIFFSLSNGKITWDSGVPLSFLASSFSFIVLVTLGTLFSLYFSKILSLLGTLLFGLFISLSNSYYLYKDVEFFKNAEQGTLHYIGTFFHYVFPRMGNINHIAQSLLNHEPANLNYMVEVPHFLVTFSLLFVLLFWVFQKKEHQF